MVMIPFCHWVRKVPSIDKHERRPRTTCRAVAGTLANRIYEHRKQLGIDQVEAATRIGISPTTLSFWECGWKEPDEVYYRRVEDFLDSR